MFGLGKKENKKPEPPKDKCRFCQSEDLISLGQGRYRDGFGLYRNGDYQSETFANVCIICGRITFKQYDENLNTKILGANDRMEE